MIAARPIVLDANILVRFVRGKEVPAGSYDPMRATAMARMGHYDPSDWPVLACALALFEAQGLQVLPVATDHDAENTADWPDWRRWLPSGEALEGSRRAIKEWVGRWASDFRLDG